MGTTLMRWNKSSRNNALIDQIRKIAMGGDDDPEIGG